MIQGRTAIERAINRAMAENLRPIRVAAGVYEVSSVKSAGKVYLVCVESPTQLSCSCIGGKYPTCKHRMAVAMFLAAEQLSRRESMPLRTRTNRRKDLYGVA